MDKLAEEKRPEKGKTKTFLIGKDLKTKDLLQTAERRASGRGNQNHRIAYAERRVKPLARLLRCATALRVTPLPSAPLGLSVCLEPCKGHKSPISTGLCESRQNPCGPQRHEKPPILPLLQPISSGSANRTDRHVE